MRSAEERARDALYEAGNAGAEIFGYQKALSVFTAALEAHAAEARRDERRATAEPAMRYALSYFTAHEWSDEDFHRAAQEYINRAEASDE